MRTNTRSFLSLLNNVCTHNQLIYQMIRREIMVRYKGSVLGIFWSLFNPIFMLTVYAFVFSVIFQARWGGVETSKIQFALVLFVGLIIQGFFAEVINRSSTLIINNTNYVKKVIFPLEILPIVSLGSALFHSLISIGVLLATILIVDGSLHWTIIFLPIILLPFILLILGFTWILASIGVFLRDISQTVTLVTMVLLFLSPVFYPITAVPIKFRPFIMANPLTFVIEQTREILIWGHMPNWLGLGFYTLIATIIAWCGYACFQTIRKEFADVL